MLEKICRIWQPRRRCRTFAEIRRQIADSGYALDDLSDSELETAITRSADRLENVLPLTGKTIYWALRKISPDDGELQKRKIKQPPSIRRAD